MNRIRLGNDVHVKWNVRVREDITLDGRDINVLLVDPFGRKTTPAFTISGNTISFDIYAKDQMVGFYSVEAYDTTSGVNRAIDKLRVLEIVPHSSMEVPPGEYVIDMESSILIGIKGDKGDPGLTKEEHDALIAATNSAEEATINANDAAQKLLEAKERGDFNGKDGYTPQKGVDYFDGADGEPGKDGAPGKDGRDGGLIYPSYKVDPHNMHLYSDTDTNRVALSKDKHFTVKF